MTCTNDFSSLVKLWIPLPLAVFKCNMVPVPHAIFPRGKKRKYQPSLRPGFQVFHHLYLLGGELCLSPEQNFKSSEHMYQIRPGFMYNYCLFFLLQPLESHHISYITWSGSERLKIWSNNHYFLNKN